MAEMSAERHGAAFPLVATAADEPSARSASMCADQYGEGEPGHADPDELAWIVVANYPISRLRDAVDADWFAAEVKMWADEGEPDRFDDMLDQPIHSPVVIYDDGQGGWTWDGNHRIGAQLTKGEATIAATVGISRDLYNALLRDPDPEAAFWVAEPLGTDRRAAVALLQTQGPSPSPSAAPRAEDATSTTEFKRWFGDSKVLNDDGSPMVAYRGLGESYRNVGGFQYWTDNAAAAGDSADGAEGAQENVVPAYLSMRNPIELNDDSAIEKLARDAGIGWLPDTPGHEVVELAAEWLRAQGYDGAVLYDDYSGTRGHRTLVTFRPDQIKSAIGTAGSFEPANADSTRNVQLEMNDAIIQTNQLSDKQAIELDALESALASACKRIAPLGNTPQARAAAVILDKIDLEIDDAVENGTLQEFVGLDGSVAKSLRMEIDGRGDMKLSADIARSSDRTPAAEQARSIEQRAKDLGVELKIDVPNDVAAGDSVDIEWIARTRKMDKSKPGKKHAGAEIMRDLGNWADANGVELKLGITDNRGASKLQEYYEGFGFERTDPLDDYDRIMVREPKSGDITRSVQRVVELDALEADRASACKRVAPLGNTPQARAADVILDKIALEIDHAVENGTLQEFVVLDGSVAKSLRMEVDGRGDVQLSADPTQSPEFKRWFGDSKVVNDDGSPMVVYHGTAVEGTTYDTPPNQLPKGAFTEFDKTYSGSVTGTSDAKAGFWFSASELRAVDAASDALEEAGSGSAYVYEVFLSMKNPLVLDNIRDYDPSEVARLARRARKAGNDGLLFKRGEYVACDYMVFEPTQVKSAIGNSGAYDSSDPDITDRRAVAAREALAFLANTKKKAGPHA